MMSAGALRAQKVFEVYKPGALDSLLRQQADTTFSFRLTTSQIADIPVYYLSKKGDTITLYRYGPAFNPSILMPQAIRNRMFNIHLNRNGLTSAPKLDRFFNALNVGQDELRLLWEKVVALKPNQMRDDVIEGYGCPVVKNEGNMLYDRNMYDGSGIIFNILTKSGLSHFYFYAPAYYEDICPGREGRKTILAIQKLLAPLIAGNK